MYRLADAITLGAHAAVGETRANEHAPTMTLSLPHIDGSVREALMIAHDALQSDLSSVSSFSQQDEQAGSMPNGRVEGVAN